MRCWWTAQVQSIEFSLVEKDVLFGLKQGNDVLKQLNKEMDLATVEKLMDDTREGIAYQEVRGQESRALQLVEMLAHSFCCCFDPQEVSALLSSRISAQDEEDVQAELAALQAEQVRLAFPRLLLVVPTAYSASIRVLVQDHSRAFAFADRHQAARSADARSPRSRTTSRLCPGRGRSAARRATSRAETGHCGVRRSAERDVQVSRFHISLAVPCRVLRFRIDVVSLSVVLVLHLVLALRSPTKRLTFTPCFPSLLLILCGSAVIIVSVST